jgi:sucrose-6-phosphate hydrolase SacC (GH32 family)
MAMAMAMAAAAPAAAPAVWQRPAAAAAMQTPAAAGCAAAMPLRSLLPLLLLLVVESSGSSSTPCPAQPCPGHPGRTYCPSVPTAGQCDQPSHSPCPPCKQPPPPPTGACQTAVDCSLGGACINGTCHCDPTWKPPNCVELNLLPVNKSSQGYHHGQPGPANESTASWGGQAVFDSGLWHLIYADFDKGCGLGCWGTNSQIARAVSTSPTGPFHKVQVVAPPFHHNPTINRRPGGGYIIVSIGNGTGSVPPPAGGLRDVAGTGDPYEAGIITMLYADKIEGPWKRRPGVILQPGSNSSWDAQVTNPSIWFHPNGSALMAYRGGCASGTREGSCGKSVGVGNSPHVAMAFAPSWDAEFVRLSDRPVWMERTEDPGLFRDARGNYHILSHAAWGTPGPGGHSFSADGRNWSFAGQAYDFHLQYSDGTSQKLGRRERPQVLIIDGQPAVLYTGVVDGGAWAAHDVSHSYTLAQRIATTTDEKAAQHLKSDDSEAAIQCTSAREKPQWPTYHPFNSVTRNPTTGALTMAHLNDANAIFEYRGVFHAMCQKGGGSWSNIVSSDLVHWFTLRDALDGPDCDGTVSFPDLGTAPYDGSTPVMLFGLACGQPLPPPPASSPQLTTRVGSSDYPRVAIAVPQRPDDPYLSNWTRRMAADGSHQIPVSFDGVPCSFPGRVWKSEVGNYWNMLCAWDGRKPWSRFMTTDPTLTSGWKLADKTFATDDAGGTPGGGAGAMFQPVPGGSDDLHMLNMDTGTSFAVGRYDPQAEKLKLISGTDGKMIRHVIDQSTRGVYKWATTGRASDGRLLTMAWIDEGECAHDSPPGPNPRDCNGMRHRSVLSLPREILYDERTQQLISRPVAELAQLRNASIISSKKYTLAPASGATWLAEIPSSAGGALDLELSFDLGDSNPQNFGVAVRASQSSVADAAVQLQFNVSAANVNGSRRTISVMDVAHPAHYLPRPVHLSRLMNDTDLSGGDLGSPTHHLPSSGDTAATCQALCDANAKCVAWVWVIRGLPAGSADCCLKSASYQCPAAAAVRPHQCKPCTLTSGVKQPSSCTSADNKPVEFNITVLEEELLNVHILVDRPLVELFVQGGRGAFVAASNFSIDKTSVHLVNDGDAAVHATVSAWGMGCGWSAQLPTPRVTKGSPLKSDDSDGTRLDCVITDYGAVADNKTVNTRAIQSAIDACHASSPSGSQVIVPAGAFKTGSLELRSNMEFHLQRGAGLFGSTNSSDYPILDRGLPFGKMWRALISGYNLTNVKVTGQNSAVPGNESIVDVSGAPLSL